MRQTISYHDTTCAKIVAASGYDWQYKYLCAIIIIFWGELLGFYLSSTSTDTMGSRIDGMVEMSDVKTFFTSYLKREPCRVVTDIPKGKKRSIPLLSGCWQFDNLAVHQDSGCKQELLILSSTVWTQLESF
jgi:hypothetical protein